MLCLFNIVNHLLIIAKLLSSLHSKMYNPSDIKLLVVNGYATRADQQFFKMGEGLRRKILKEKCLLIHVSTRVHIHVKTRQTCNSFSLLPFQEDFLLFITLFHFWNLKGGFYPPPPPSRSANALCYGWLGYYAVSAVFQSYLYTIINAPMISVVLQRFCFFHQVEDSF